MSLPLPSPSTRWRCQACGNLTRFTVVRSERAREFWHVDLAGEAKVEESEVDTSRIESVTCRWCDRSDTVQLVPRVEGAG